MVSFRVMVNSKMASLHLVRVVQGAHAATPPVDLSADCSALARTQNLDQLQSCPIHISTYPRIHVSTSTLSLDHPPFALVRSNGSSCARFSKSGTHRCESGSRFLFSEPSSESDRNQPENSNSLQFSQTRSLFAERCALITILNGCKRHCKRAKERLF